MLKLATLAILGMPVLAQVTCDDTIDALERSFDVDIISGGLRTDSGAQKLYLEIAYHRKYSPDSSTPFDFGDQCTGSYELVQTTGEVGSAYECYNTYTLTVDVSEGSGDCAFSLLETADDPTIPADKYRYEGRVSVAATADITLASGDLTLTATRELQQPLLWFLTLPKSLTLSTGITAQNTGTCNNDETCNGADYDGSNTAYCNAELITSDTKNCFCESANTGAGGGLQGFCQCPSHSTYPLSTFNRCGTYCEVDCAPPVFHCPGETELGDSATTLTLETETLPVVFDATLLTYADASLNGLFPFQALNRNVRTGGVLAAPFGGNFDRFDPESTVSLSQTAQGHPLQALDNSNVDQLLNYEFGGIGTFQYTYTAVDSAETPNAAPLCTVAINVVDIGAPTIICPPDTSTNVWLSWDLPTATDAIDPMVDIYLAQPVLKE